jgi:heterodisulfide reductase subunit A
MPDTKKVLVIGGGIAGLTVADRLSRAGQDVHLVEKQSAVGGRITEMGCKAAETCLRCNVCVANQLLRNVAVSEKINIHTRTELAKLDAGSNGSLYTATLKHEPNFIDREKCTGCRACMDACPEKCITIHTTTTQPAVPILNYSSCRLAAGKNCSICSQACPVGAINMKDKSSQSKLDLDAVVVATGYEPYNPAENASYGFGQTPNIITGIEAEKQLSDSTQITRPSDGKPPKRIAFIQCVGSRSELNHRRPEDTDYCSTVCCAYALRMARLLKHNSPDTLLTIFYMDIQNFGKGFDEFYNKCKDSMTFIRSRPYEVKPAPDGTVTITYAPQSPQDDADSQLCREEFDLAVLAVGIRPNPDTTRLAEKLLVPLDEYGFFGLKNASALPELQHKGIFTAGACESPKDIQACMAQAEAVSAAILSDY